MKKKLSTKRYKIVYMGTPDFAVPPLKRLAEEGYDIPFVVTMPDRARGRGKKLSAPEVKLEAEALGISVLQPLGKEDFPRVIKELKKAEPDIIVVAAYGHILPKEILELPPLGCINIHASILPRHRGASPIQSAILSGDKETGVSIMYMAEAMDEGDVIACAKTETENKTAGELFQELSELGAELLIKSLPAIIAGQANRTPQNHSLATYSTKIKKEDSIIDFNKTAEEISRQIRAMSPSPGARTNHKGKLLIITKAETFREIEGTLGYSVNGAKDKIIEHNPGRVVRVDAGGILVATGQGKLLIQEIKPAGKKTMEVFEYIKGNKIDIGEILG